MTATQVFLYFLNHELDPVERQAFITEIENKFEKEGHFKKKDRKKFVEIFVEYYGIHDNWWQPKCSMLRSFMNHLLQFYVPEIIGFSPNDVFHGKTNYFILKMGYKFKESYRKGHIKYYCKKWQNFIDENIENGNEIVRFYEIAHKDFKLKKIDGKNSSL